MRRSPEGISISITSPGFTGFAALTKKPLILILPCKHKSLADDLRFKIKVFFKNRSIRTLNYTGGKGKSQSGKKFLLTFSGIRLYLSMLRRHT